MVTAELATVEGMYRLSFSFKEEPEPSVCMYGNVPRIVAVDGWTESDVDICESVRVPLFVIVTGIEFV
jgi:hypothetical protein